ncbi:putative 3-beta hydroxysteroid dehydrogenase/isomerase family protein [Aspergillus lucknowensis]|uniref:Thioester reductase (TE) domain-containing protein n=1 Tax=Aspergillus lucknowensis TaxID=176173 RepID=A0ABR4LQD1_9EURO
MCLVPEEARTLPPRRWTVEEIKAAYKKAVHSPIDVTKSLPHKQNRRYIVVGGSGLVGNWIISHLIARGERPAAIQTLHLNPPRRELLDLAVQRAFSQPWPSQVASLPLTVFHKAAVIRPAERHKAFLPLCRNVNVGGTANVLNAAKRAGASCFVSTSSGSVSIRRPSFWIAPWEKIPRHFVQVISDAAEPLKKHDGFFGNYAASKLEAEGFVRAADDLESSFRTGCIRPAKWNICWLLPTIQNFVNAENVSIAHLLYEQRLIEHTKNPSGLPNIGGQAFVVTDPNPAVTFGDVFLLLLTLATTPVRFPEIPPLPMLLLLHVFEWYILLRHLYLPWLRRPTSEMMQLEPALFAMLDPHVIIDDSRVRKPPEQGGLGYSPPLTSLDGMCRHLEHWNRLAAERGTAAMMGKGMRTYTS